MNNHGSIEKKLSRWSLAAIDRQARLGETRCDTLERLLAEYFEPSKAPGPDWALLECARNQHRAPEESHWLTFLGYALPRAQGSKAQLFQDLWALWETREKRGGYFVEFGACDGINLSNTYALEKDWGWTGVVAEPSPVFRDALRENRGCRISELCVWSQSGLSLEFKVVSEPEYSTLRLIDPMDSHERLGRRKDYTEVTVETISLNDLLIDSEAPYEIDYLSIDTEGSELEIIKDFDFSSRRIKLITIEHNNTPRRAEIIELLDVKGYEHRFPNHTRWDDWFRLRA